MKTLKKKNQLKLRWDTSWRPSRSARGRTPLPGGRWRMRPV